MQQPATTTIDIYSAEVASDLFPVLEELRELSPVVHLPEHDVYMLTRYEEVREASGDWESFSSRYGVGLRDDFNDFIIGTILGTDPPEHDALRTILYDKLTPRALSALRPRIDGWAQELAAELVARGAFDACEDLAFQYPVTVVANLAGLPEEGRERFRPGADAQFAGFGPFTPYLAERIDDLVAYQQWMFTMSDPNVLAPGSWGASIMEAVAEGRVTPQDAATTINAFMTAGMDTTVNAISAMFRVFAEQPEVWDAIRRDPALIRPALAETLRLHTPVTGFFRVATRDLDVAGIRIPEGKRVLLHWASANRDPRHYDDPDEFRLERNPLDHLAFGYGQHSCPGRTLATIEIVALIEAFIPLVERFELSGAVVQGRNPVVHGLDSVPLTVTAAAAAA